MSNEAPGKLLDVLPGAGSNFGVDLANECMKGSILPVENGGTGVVGGSYTNGQLLIGKTSTGTLVAGTLTGTSNQITVTNGAGSITLSTPQSIGTGSSPTFAGLTLSSPLTVANGGTGLATLTANNLLIGNGTGNVTFVAPGTAGNFLRSTGTAWASTAPDTGTVTLTAGASGDITNANVTTASIIMVSYQGASLTNSGQLAVNPQAGKFTIGSTNGSDANKVAYFVVKY